MVALFNSGEARRITKRIKEYQEKLERRIEEPISHDDYWTLVKQYYYPSEPVIKLPEMDPETMNPYPDPHGYRKATDFKFSEGSSERYNRSGANRFRRQGTKWS